MAGIDRQNPLRAARAVLLAARATGRARRLLKRIGADAVLGGGGYVAGPVGLAARTLRLPLALTEADSHLGLTNRLLAPVARRVFLAFPLEGRGGSKYLVTGRPVPAGTEAGDREAARARLGVDAGRSCVLVFGGSLGARRLNEAALDAFGRRRPGRCCTPPASVTTTTCAGGSTSWARLQHYRLFPFIEPFADALAAADLAVARAGGSVFELAAAGLPAILVPYPHATADHQTANARFMEKAGRGGRDPGQPSSTAPGWPARWPPCWERPQRTAAMAKAARAVARPDAADRIAEELLALV